MWQKRITGGPILDESHVPRYVCEMRHGKPEFVEFPRRPSRPAQVQASDLGIRDAAAKVRAWDDKESLVMPNLTQQTGAHEGAVQFLVFEFLRGPGNTDAIARRAAKETNWNYSMLQRIIAQSFARCVLTQGWDAAIATRGGELHTTSYHDALRNVLSGLSAALAPPAKLTD